MEFCMIIWKFEAKSLNITVFLQNYPRPGIYSWLLVSTIGSEAHSTIRTTVESSE